MTDGECSCERYWQPDEGGEIIDYGNADSCPTCGCIPYPLKLNETVPPDRALLGVRCPACQRFCCHRGRDAIEASG